MNAKKRIVVALALVLIAVFVGICEHIGFNATRYLGLAVVFGMCFEVFRCMTTIDKKILNQNSNHLRLFLFLSWLIMMLFAINDVGQHPWIILLLLLVICAADIGAWFFGSLIGGAKLWENISAKKTWSGQICGIVCGAVVAVLCGVFFFDSQLLWMGISVALLSQYGDLTASWVKRNLKIKDFGSLLPGHGGLLDRFDGWLYVLPLIWILGLFFGY